MSENRAVENILGQLTDIIAKNGSSSTLIQEPSPATNEQPPVQTSMVNGANTKVGDLVAEVMEAVNRSSPDLLKGRRGITIGMLVPPTVDARDEMRPDESYIPKTPIDKLTELPSVGGVDLDAFASKAGTLMSEMLTQRSALTLPSTKLAESLAKVRRLNLITEGEADQLEKLVTLADQGLPIPTEYSLLLSEGRLSPLFKGILSCTLAVVQKSSSLSKVGRILDEGQNRYRASAGADTPARPDTYTIMDAYNNFSVLAGIHGMAEGVTIGFLGGLPGAVIGGITGFLAGGAGQMGKEIGGKKPTTLLN